MSRGPRRPNPLFGRHLPPDPPGATGASGAAPDPQPRGEGDEHAGRDGADDEQGAGRSMHSEGSATELLLTALSEAGPEAAEHLLKAAQELLLAAKAVVDAAERAVEAHRESATGAASERDDTRDSAPPPRIRRIDLGG